MPIHLNSVAFKRLKLKVLTRAYRPMLPARDFFLMCRIVCHGYPPPWDWRRSVGPTKKPAVCTAPTPVTVTMSRSTATPAECCLHWLSQPGTRCEGYPLLFPVHRHALLLSGGQNAAAGDHPPSRHQWRHSGGCSSCGSAAGQGRHHRGRRARLLHHAYPLHHAERGRQVTLCSRKSIQVSNHPSNTNKTDKSTIFFID